MVYMFEKPCSFLTSPFGHSSLANLLTLGICSSFLSMYQNTSIFHTIQCSPGHKHNCHPSLVSPSEVFVPKSLEHILLFFQCHVLLKQHHQFLGIHQPFSILLQDNWTESATGSTLTKRWEAKVRSLPMVCSEVSSGKLIASQTIAFGNLWICDSCWVVFLNRKWMILWSKLKFTMSNYCSLNFSVLLNYEIVKFSKISLFVISRTSLQSGHQFIHLLKRSSKFFLEFYSWLPFSHELFQCENFHVLSNCNIHIWDCNSCLKL